MTSIVIDMTSIKSRPAKLKRAQVQAFDPVIPGRKPNLPLKLRLAIVESTIMKKKKRLNIAQRFAGSGGALKVLKSGHHGL